MPPTLPRATQVLKSVKSFTLANFMLSQAEDLRIIRAARQAQLPIPFLVFRLAQVTRSTPICTLLHLPDFKEAHQLDIFNTAQVSRTVKILNSVNP
ncbi:hypothetical protein PtA15_13A501 [Puccinia triticina]|uniref:Uncharacterized protein n=1 Tax=Puccinia triticina TaxID=208348 RepID=A0ABY7D541_9BASI|nr:uncharacterized protein PtA15_13A501 [Puccinia triticina]WAQ91100.1 hypothetical protein PtA15_13A501 [Puccinia triticina]WAR61290.1 hypothetical protein PtB15_13B545 [Puccinia triticina]